MRPEKMQGFFDFCRSQQLCQLTADAQSVCNCMSADS